MALSDQEKKIRRLCKLVEQEKPRTKEIKALKAWFQEQSAGKDVVFKSSKGLEVLVTNGSKQLWDGDLLAAHFAEKAVMWKYTSTYQSVTCREAK